MMIKVNPAASLDSKIAVPGSKSKAIRAILFALLAKGESHLLRYPSSEDTCIAMDVVRAMGADLKPNLTGLSITSEGLPFTSSAEIYTGNSGITTRFVLPILGLRKNADQPVLLHCGKQMQDRPIDSLVHALNQLGMSIQYKENRNSLPLLVSGSLQGGEAEVDGITSQYLSALLIALPCASKDSIISVRNLHERPYVEMTLHFLQQQNISYTHHQTETMDEFHITGNQQYSAFDMNIPGDFSAASCLITAAVLHEGEVELTGLDITDQQGDKRFISILQQMGAEIKMTADSIKIKGQQKLNGICIDANDIPDLVPALAVIGCFAESKTEIKNVKQARIKETDRIHSMTEGLCKMGAHIEEKTDGMIIHPRPLKAARVNGYDDHRTVMALTVAGMLAEGNTFISGAEAINKTYPGFVEDLKTLGANVEIQQHIFLIGFKHVGKTRVGRQLAQELNKPFIDLDKEMEKTFLKNSAEILTCRQIMQIHGEKYFRQLESEVLQQVLMRESSVVSLGGGTVINQQNQQRIAGHFILHITAARGIVFERIMVDGHPGFFKTDQDPYESFTQLWNERDQIYRQLTARTVNNNDSLQAAVNQAMHHLEGSLHHHG